MIPQPTKIKKKHSALSEVNLINLFPQFQLLDPLLQILDDVEELQNGLVFLLQGVLDIAQKTLQLHHSRLQLMVFLLELKKGLGSWDWLCGGSFLGIGLLFAVRKLDEDLLFLWNSLSGRLGH